MKIAVTGATGFLGRYITNHLLAAGHECRCWHRPESDRGGFEESAAGRLEWLSGQLGDAKASAQLVRGVDAVVHAALRHEGSSFRGGEGELIGFVETNVVGTLKLIEAAISANVKRFVFISTCAVHEVILPDRPLDETHVLWPNHHYGAHKAAIEKFVHSFGLGGGYDICSLRPTGIYGLARPASRTRWYRLIQSVRKGRPVESARGGKEVHASDVAKAVEILLTADGIAGQCYNCYDMYISEERVARIAKELTGSDSNISSLNEGPRNEIVTARIQALGMKFGGEGLLRKTVQEILEAQ